MIRYYKFHFAAADKIFDRFEERQKRKGAKAELESQKEAEEKQKKLAAAAQWFSVVKVDFSSTVYCTTQELEYKLSCVF